MGTNADRVLLVGNGISVGYGVLSHDLGLPGMLARRLSVLTGRGAEVHVRSSPNMTTSAAAVHLADADVSKYDAIVLTFGGIESVMLAPKRKWGKGVEATIALLLERAPTSSLFFIGAPSPDRVVRMPRLYQALTAAHARDLNEIAREICARYPNATFVEFNPPSTRIVDGINSDHYGKWAALIAAPIAAGLDEHLDPDPTPVDEELRLKTLDAMNLADPDADAELDQIVAAARDLFGASGAAINVIGGTRQWGLAAIGLPKVGVPREFSVCARTIF
ncbi:MAG: hypothetical protein Q8M65_07285, partial [Rhodoglobus sp.]|nr:hypothetical protein [Rhodoglobus sp.]